MHVVKREQFYRIFFMHHTTDNQDGILDLILAGVFSAVFACHFCAQKKRVKVLYLYPPGMSLYVQLFEQEDNCDSHVFNFELNSPKYTYICVANFFLLWFQFLNACPPGRSFYKRFYFHSLTSSLLLLDCKNLNVDCLNCHLNRMQEYFSLSHVHLLWMVVFGMKFPF